MRRCGRRMRAGVFLMALTTACGSSPVPASTTPTSAGPAPSVTTTASPTTTGAPTTTATSTTTTSTTTASPTTTGAPTTTSPPPPPPPSVTIPVGPDGISYREGGFDLEASGPSLLAVTDDGVAHLFDPAGRRLAHVSATGLEFTDLVSLDILSVTAMTADGLDLILVEVFFGPERQRLHRLDPSREVVGSVDLPLGFRLEDGLSGVLSDDQGDVLIEYRGGESYGRYDAVSDSFSIEPLPTIRGIEVEPRAPDLVIDGVLLTADLVGEFGALRYMATDRSGRHVVERIEVLSTSPIEVLRTVEWYTADGRFLESALVPPLEEQAIDQAPGLAVTAGGDVIVLLALEDVVIVRPLEGRPERIVG